MKTNSLIIQATLTLIGIVLFQISFCQTNFKSGYIIRLNGDTLRGYIDYRSWERNPDIISFKEKMDKTHSLLTPLTIKRFSVSDELYESAIIETDANPDISNDLQQNNETVIKIDTTFLQTMVNGPKSLYYYKNKLDKIQFYIRQNDAFVLLTHKELLTKDEKGNSLITENKRYLGQLNFYLQDCPNIQSKLSETSYNKGSLESLFNYYYNNSNSKIQFQKKAEGLGTELGIIAGPSFTSLTFHYSPSYVALTSTNFSKSINFSAGVYLDLLLPRNLKNWSLCNELFFTSYNVNGSYHYDPAVPGNAVAYATFGYSYLKLNNIIRFKYLIGNAFIYADAGISNGYAINEVNKRRFEQTINNTLQITYSKALNASTKYEQGFILGLGTKIKKYSFEFRYEKAGAMSNNDNLRSLAIRYYLLLGYKFN